MKKIAFSKKMVTINTVSNYIKMNTTGSDGRYVAPIPWTVDGPKLKHLYRKALKIFLEQKSL